MRPILPETLIHPAIRQRIAEQRMDHVREVQAAVAEHRVVVVGMAINPVPKRARKLLRAAGVEFKYLTYGSYLGDWRRRTSLKMWTGWHTFPMIFVDGIFVGGADDVEKLIGSGELKATLARPRPAALLAP